MGEILTTARTWHRDYHAGKLSYQEIAQQRSVIEAQLLAVLGNPPVTGWPADAIRLAKRIQRHWREWFTFLDNPEVKPDNNDAERALRKRGRPSESNWRSAKRLGRSISSPNV